MLYFIERFIEDAPERVRLEDLDKVVCCMSPKSVVTPSLLYLLVTFNPVTVWS